MVKNQDNSEDEFHDMDLEEFLGLTREGIKIEDDYVVFNGKRMLFFDWLLQDEEEEEEKINKNIKYSETYTKGPCLGPSSRDPSQAAAHQGRECQSDHVTSPPGLDAHCRTQRRGGVCRAP